MVTITVSLPPDLVQVIETLRTDERYCMLSDDEIVKCALLAGLREASALHSMEPSSTQEGECANEFN